MTLLSRIATISRGATPGNSGQGAAYLRLSNIENGRLVGAVQPGPLPARGIETRLKMGDIVVRSRGPDLSAALVGRQQIDCFATSDIFVVRPDPSRVISAYLAAYMSLPATQAVLTAGAQGAAMAHLNRPALACLSIPLPSIPRQLAIGRLTTAAAREWEIVHEIAELSHRLRQELLHRLMEEARTGEAIPKRGHIPGPNDAVTSSALPSAPKQKVPLK